MWAILAVIIVCTGLIPLMLIPVYGDISGPILGPNIISYDLLANGTSSFKIINPDLKSGSLFGQSVAVNGDLLVVGSPFYYDGSVSGSVTGSGIGAVVGASGSFVMVLVSPVLQTR